MLINYDYLFYFKTNFGVFFIIAKAIRKKEGESATHTQRSTRNKANGTKTESTGERKNNKPRRESKIKFSNGFYLKRSDRERARKGENGNKCVVCMARKFIIK